MSQPIIHFDYDFSPYGQKTKLLLTAAGVNYKKCDQPRVLPRPDLEAIGITYRRIPLLAVGKDIYADSSRMIDLITSKLASGAVTTSPADKAFEDWGNNVFREILGILPSQALTPEFIKDRETIFPALKRPDWDTLKPSTVAGFQARCKQVEDTFLANGGPFLNGDKLSLADIHFIWCLRWGMKDLGGAQEPGCGKDAFPKLWKMIESLPPAKPEVLSSEETLKTIRESDYSADGPTSVMKGDALGMTAGTPVKVESTDAKPGAHVQLGKLVGTSANEVVIEVGNDGVRLHFPRIGYLVRPQEQGSKL
ncbi:hypothetical protein LTR97_003116 [Elasticomyces elasticus]|uniref:GST N-terminal domain-containing protein n=1 Tax=Elasticomyces elasticus TaxID=574655 RepID=A0AAN7VVB8_9PEZI|nr:hypothetical protein LTR97_003116 [Elasticomyces elasticus]